MGDHVMAIRLRLAGRLRAARLAAGLTQQEAAALVFWPPSKYSRLEGGVRAVRRSDLLTLLPALQIPAEQHDELLHAALLSTAKAVYQKYDSILSGPEIEYFDAVAVADEVCEVSLGLIPMMLRTPAYQEAVIDVHLAVHPYQPRESWDLLFAQVRGILATIPRPKCTFVVDESALKRRVGGDDVMREQLAYLGRRVNKRDLRLSVVPFSAGLLSGLQRSFTLLSWRDHPEEDLVAGVAVSPPMTITRDAHTVSRHRNDFTELLEYGSTPADVAQILDGAQQKL